MRIPQRAEYFKERNGHLRAAGLCTSCVETAEPRRTLCRKCLDKASARERDKRKDPQVREAYNAKQRESFRRRRIEAINLYGGKCTCCGESETDFLSFDHINNDGAQQRKRIAPGGHLFGYLLKHKPSDIQVLCHNCNMARYFYGVCPHQRVPVLVCVAA